jgi:hypothetical protein
VTLLGYVHLAFLVNYTPASGSNLKLVWNVAAKMRSTKEAPIYWRTIDEAVCRAVAQTANKLTAFKEREAKLLRRIKAIEIQHLNAEVERAMKLTKEELVQRLIAEMRISSRIEQINGVNY